MEPLDSCFPLLLHPGTTLMDLIIKGSLNSCPGTEIGATCVLDDVCCTTTTTTGGANVITM